MCAIVIKSHIEPTAGRAKIAGEISKFNVIGGGCLNSGVGGLNPETVRVTAAMGGVKYCGFQQFLHQILI